MDENPAGRTVARLLVECLENEGVEYVFGLPGEENPRDRCAGASSIRFVTTRDERGAASMADTYGALTGRPGVCLATPGPGVTQPDARDRERASRLSSARRDHRAGGPEPHQQGVAPSGRPDPAFQPITKWGDVTVGDAVPEMVRKAFKQARTERPGATFVILLEDIADQTTDRTPLRVNVPVDPAPSEVQVRRAAGGTDRPMGRRARGPGVARDGAMDALVRFSEALNLLVATTFLGKGVFPDDHPNALGNDRVHGARLRQLRLRRGRRGRGRRLRPRGVRA